MIKKNVIVEIRIFGEEDDRNEVGNLIERGLHLAYHAQFQKVNRVREKVITVELREPK